MTDADQVFQHCWHVATVVVLSGAQRRAVGRQLSLDAIESQLRSRMMHILNKSNQQDVDLELDRLQTELLARGKLRFI